MKHNIDDYEKVLNKMHHWVELRRIQEIDHGWIFEYEDNLYLVSDNGGETNIYQINGEGTSVPHTSHKINVTPIVLAYRLSMYLLGLPINYDLTHDKLQNAIKVEYLANEGGD